MLGSLKSMISRGPLVPGGNSLSLKWVFFLFLPPHNSSQRKTPMQCHAELKTSHSSKKISKDRMLTAWKEKQKLRNISSSSHINVKGDSHGLFSLSLLFAKGCWGSAQWATIFQLDFSAASSAPYEQGPLMKASWALLFTYPGHRGNYRRAKMSTQSC